MSHWVPGRPSEHEYSTRARPYVESVPGEDVLAVLQSQVNRTLALIENMDERRASEWSYEPGKWSVKQVLGHLSDTERIFSYRALRIARGDKTPLAPLEQDYIPYADANSRALADLAAEFRAVRQATLILYRSFSPEAWDRTGIVSDRQLSVRGIVFTTAGHEIHHANILQDRYGL